MIRTARLIGVSLSVGLAGLLALPPGSWAEWSAIAQTKTIVTDNVFELSAARRLALSEDPSQPVVVPTDRPSDLVWTPSIDVRHTSSSSLGPTELSFKAHGYLFTNNPVFNHGDYRAQVHQQIAPDTFVLLRYRYVPNLFLGPNTERQTGRRLQEEERVTSHTWRMQFERRLSEQWSATLVGRYGLRFFNQAFSERDTKFYTVGPRLRYRPVSWATITFDYLYERGLADGRDQPQFKDDVSYRQHFVSLGTVFQLAAPLSLELTYAFREKQFTSEIVGDSARGEIDYLHQGNAELHYDVSAAARVTLGLQRTQRSSNIAARDFYNTNASVGLEYRF